MRLESKVVIVTGAASGIGAAAVDLFKKEGAIVVVTDIAQVAGIVKADAANEEEVARPISNTVNEHGGLSASYPFLEQQYGKTTL